MKINRTIGRSENRHLYRILALLLVVVVAIAFLVSRPAAAGPMFKASLDGSQEVPPVTTTATGSARFEFNDALTELSFELNVFDLDDITQAHIHLGAAGTNGPVVAFLLSTPVTGPVNGLLASGILTADDLLGPLGGQSLSELHNLMATELTYVNVHTEAFPGGEIRGQIVIPEPGTLGLFGLGFAGLLFTLSRRGRARRP